jgi:uncharacterized membrane protein YsdA (DUF1294 family)
MAFLADNFFPVVLTYGPATYLAVAICQTPYPNRRCQSLEMGLVAFAGVNVLTFGCFAWDKFWSCCNCYCLRFSQNFLLGLCAAGGAPGGYLAMLLFNHKVSCNKWRFQENFQSIVGSHFFMEAALAGGLFMVALLSN